MAKPVVGQFMLPAVPDGLLKHAVFVTKAVARCGELHRGHGIEKARREASETSIAKTSIRFFLDQSQPVQVFLIDNVRHQGIEQEVRDIIGERASDEEFHREVVNPLWVGAVVGSVGAYPTLGQKVTDRAGEGIVVLASIRDRGIDAIVQKQVALIQPV